MKEFYDVVSYKQALDKFINHFFTKGTAMQKTEEVSLAELLGRAAAENIYAVQDVPPFGRSAKDGFAVVASDTYYADEEKPARLSLNSEVIMAGTPPKAIISKGSAVGISTGAMIPRGANAVVMVEDAVADGSMLDIFSPAAPGENIMHAGSDIMQGEILVYMNQSFSPRETALLASSGITSAKVYKKPAVAVFSTGNEITEPGKRLSESKIYDINSRIICDFCREDGAVPVFRGIIEDRLQELKEQLAHVTEDMVILSGGTSKGGGDISYRAVEELGEMIVHGVAIKPGKPVALGKIMGRPVIMLPGFPTSAAITYCLFARPLIRMISGAAVAAAKKITVNAAVRINSDKGKREFVLLNLAGSKDSLFAYPISKGSGAISEFSMADGFCEVDENTEYIKKGSQIEISLFSESFRPADLNFIGSHCVLLEPAVSMLKKKGISCKVMHAGSSLGLDAAARGESDITGTHLLDEKTGDYNTPFLSEGLALFRGYNRVQGIVFRKEPGRQARALSDFVFDKGLRMLNRNPGSGTRVLFDICLKDIIRKDPAALFKNKIAGNHKVKDNHIEESRVGEGYVGKTHTEEGCTEESHIEENYMGAGYRSDSRDIDPLHAALTASIPGYESISSTHSAVCAAVATGKADWGIAVKNVAENYGLGFIPLRDENYDFCIPKDKIQKPAVQEFLRVISSGEFKDILSKNEGVVVPKDIGEQLWP